MTVVVVTVVVMDDLLVLRFEMGGHDGDRVTQ